MANDYTQLKDKLQLIFWPYLRLVLLFLVVYGLLDWALLAWVPTFEPPEELRKLGVPLLLSVGLVWVFLWPRLRLLTGSDDRRDARPYLAMIAAAVMGCAANCLHGYLADSRAPMTVLESPAAVDTGQPLGQYYQFRRVFSTPRYRGGDVQFGTSDKGRKLTFQLYIATPMLASPADTLRPAAVWLGREYSDDIGSGASDAEKETALQAFIKRSEHAFELEDFSNPLGHYVRLPNTEARESYTKAARRTGLCPPDTTRPLLVLQAATEPFVARGQSSLHWLQGWLLVGSLLFSGLLLAPALVASRVATFRAGRWEPAAWPDALRPRAGYCLTPLLLLANGVVYLALALATHSGIDSFAVADLLAWGANHGPAVAQGEWWRLLTSTFLHGNILHLANNMVLLWLLGAQLEEFVGTGRLSLVYLVGGLGGSLASLAWHPDGVGVGASGAIFGVMGAALVLAWRRALPSDLGGVMLVLVGSLTALNLVLGFVMPGVDNAAHLGGLFTGALLGFVLVPGMMRRRASVESTAPEA